MPSTTQALKFAPFKPTYFTRPEHSLTLVHPSALPTLSLSTSKLPTSKISSKPIPFVMSSAQANHCLSRKSLNSISRNGSICLPKLTTSLKRCYHLSLTIVRLRIELWRLLLEGLGTSRSSGWVNKLVLLRVQYCRR